MSMKCKKKFNNSLLFIILITNGVFPLGKTAVPTLVHPSGSINTGMGECGVSLADNIYSASANPASLPAIGEKNIAQFYYSTFNEDLLPKLQHSDHYHTTQYSGVIINDIYSHFDFGYAYSKNYTHLGITSWTDEQGREIESAHSYEEVKGNTIAFRAFKVASIGINIKPFESVLAPGYGPNREATANGLVYDLGLRLEYKHTFWNMLTIHPAIGLSLQNYGQKSVYYISPEESEPLPRTRLYGGSIQTDFINLLGVNLAREREYAVIDEQKIEHIGIKVDITPFYSIIKGQLIDPAGERDQGMDGQVITFNFYKTLQCIQGIYNLVKGDQSNKSIIGLSQPINSLKLNVIYQKATNTIESYSKDNGTRNGQTRNDYTIGINLISTLFQFTKQKEKE